jgi:hypothetical protein
MKKESKVVDPLAYLAKLSIPIGVATTVIGGSAWLTTLHNKVEAVESTLDERTDRASQERRVLFQKADNTETRLSRIEGKIDILLERMKGHK